MLGAVWIKSLFEEKSVFEYVFHYNKSPTGQALLSEELRVGEITLPS